MRLRLQTVRRQYLPDSEHHVCRPKRMSGTTGRASPACWRCPMSWNLTGNVLSICSKIPGGECAGMPVSNPASSSNCDRSPAGKSSGHGYRRRTRSSLAFRSRGEAVSITRQHPGKAFPEGNPNEIWIPGLTEQFAKWGVAFNLQVRLQELNRSLRLRNSTVRRHWTSLLECSRCEGTRR